MLPPSQMVALDLVGLPQLESEGLARVLAGQRGTALQTLLMLQ